jgi:hypothetical protein
MKVFLRAGFLVEEHVQVERGRVQWFWTVDAKPLASDVHHMLGGEKVQTNDIIFVGSIS